VELETLRRLAGSFWIRLLVSAGLLAVVATQIDFHTVGSRISGASWGWFVAAIAVLFASFLVAALRWQLSMNPSRLCGPTRKRPRSVAARLKWNWSANKGICAISTKPAARN
jgi:hypothetical protein